MQNTPPSVASFHMHDSSYWEIRFKPNAILNLEEVTRIYHYIDCMAPGTPILFELNGIEGITFEAMEYIAAIEKRDHPLIIATASGSIGERYVHMLNQLSHEQFQCFLFNSTEEAKAWIGQGMKKEA